MIRTTWLLLLFSFVAAPYACVNVAPGTSSSLLFESKPNQTPISPGMIDEASGIAESRTGKGFLWVEQDSGNPPEIYRLGKDGVLINKCTLKGISNRDWEDLVISTGPKPGVNYLYLAETGDNLALHNNYAIYRFEEPADNIDTVSSIEKIRFQYPGTAHDAEAILVDHISKDIYIITKRDAKSLIFKLKYPQDLTKINTPELMGALPFNTVVSATLSSGNTEMIVKTYTNLYYWKKTAQETIENTLLRPGINLGYQSEPQGEGICFAGNDAGFYTLGEKPFAVSRVKLSFYKRK